MEVGGLVFFEGPRRASDACQPGKGVPLMRVKEERKRKNEDNKKKQNGTEGSLQGMEASSNNVLLKQNQPMGCWAFTDSSSVKGVVTEGLSTCVRV